MQLDDALIYLRYFRNVKEGAGLVYNPGENFNGLTSVLFSYLMLFFSLFFKDFLALSTFVSFLSMSFAAIVAGYAFSDDKYERFFVALVVSVFGFFYLTFGMETSLFLALIGLTLYLCKKNSDLVFPVLSLLILTRSEGVFLAVLVAIDYLRNNKKFPNVFFVIGSMILLFVPYVFNYLYYGSVVSETGEAKIGQGRSGLWGEGWIFLNVRYLLDLAFSGSSYSVVFICVAAFFGAVVNVKNRVGLISVLFLFLLAAFYVGLNIPNYHWYYGPFFYFLNIFLSLGVWRLGGVINGVQDSAKKNVLALSLAILFGFSIWNTVNFKYKEPFRPYIDIGNWLRYHTPEKSSIGLVEIGAVGWYSNRPIVDVLGLVNKHNSGYIGERDFYSWLTHYQPNYIIKHEPVWPHEVSISMLQDKGFYRPVDEFVFPGYALLKKSAPDDVIKSAVGDLVATKKSNDRWFNQLVQSGQGESPSVLLESGYLFAHAPSELYLKLDKAYGYAKIKYGVKKEAQGKHSGVCFEVVNLTSGKEIISGCVESNSEIGMMARQSKSDFVGSSGDVISFKTRCLNGCNYAWSYWDGVEFSE